MIEFLSKALGLCLLLAVAAAAPAQEPTGNDDREPPPQETVEQDREAEESAPEPSAEEGSEAVEMEVEAADRFEPTEQIDEDYSIDFPVDI